MTKTSDPDDRADPAGRARPVPDTDQRRLFRPEDPSDERRTIFSDWASI